MPVSLAEQLYHRWRRAQHDITAHPAWGNLESEQRLAWEAVAGVAPLFIAPRSIEAGEVVTLEMRPPAPTCEEPIPCGQCEWCHAEARRDNAARGQPPAFEGTVLEFQAFVEGQPDLHGDIIEPAALEKAVEEYAMLCPESSGLPTDEPIERPCGTCGRKGRSA